MAGAAELTGHERVTRLLDHEPSRVRTVRLMAGGNPRTVVLLFSVLAQGTDGDVRADLERLLDLCTPLYKHRLEVLPDLRLGIHRMRRGTAVPGDR